MTDGLFKSIDKIRKRFDNDDFFNLNDACWLLWAERCIISADYLSFAEWVLEGGVTLDTKYKWEIWSGLFDAYMETEDYENRRYPKGTINSILRPKNENKKIRFTANNSRKKKKVAMDSSL